MIEGDERLLPESLVLWLTLDGKVRRYCTLAWRLQGQLGVKFEKKVSA